MRRATSAGLKAAVHRSKPLSRAGVLERLFTLAFERLVYPAPHAHGLGVHMTLDLAGRARFGPDAVVSGRTLRSEADRG